MPDTSRKRLRRTTISYMLLLLYIVAALVWWFISLSRQNDMMRDFKITNLNATINKNTSALYYVELNKINTDYRRNKGKYLGEGSIFLLLIFVGAAFLYRSVRKQFYMQQQQQNFMMAVTHELKTPISVAKLNLETLQKYSLDPERQKKLIKMTLQETARLDFLTNNILIASQLEEGGGYKSSKEEIDLSDLVTDCVSNFGSRFPERVFIKQIEQGTDVKADPLLLQILINNLLENAIKYSSKESPVTALLQKNNSLITVNIIDSGPGIPDDEKKNIFTKFYRIGNENTRKTQGTGLGLYLCRKIARDHNGDITVTNNSPHGSNFTVTLPLSINTGIELKEG
jgi:two-component system sensor histidine kinase CiaH